MKYSLLILLKYLFLFAPAKQDIPASIYDFKVAAVKGSDIDLSEYKGKKILIVNTPWFNNTDRQYAELDALAKKYPGKLVIIGFLSDDFGMAPGAGKVAAQTTKRSYNISFPLAAKVGIKGDSRAPIYKWLTEKQYNNLKDSYVKWNFQKYLINEDGQLVAVFDPKVKATDPKLIAAIEN